MQAAIMASSVNVVMDNARTVAVVAVVGTVGTVATKATATTMETITTIGIHVQYQIGVLVEGMGLVVFLVFVHDGGSDLVGH